MPDRATLHVNKVEAFVAWAETKGYVREMSKGQYEALRLRHPAEDKPVLFYKKGYTLRGSTEVVHLTCQEDGSKLVQEWLGERREKRTKIE